MIQFANIITNAVHKSVSGEVEARVMWIFDNDNHTFTTDRNIHAYINGFLVTVNLDDLQFPDFSLPMKVSALESATADIAGAIWNQIFGIDIINFDKDTDDEEDEGFRW